MPKPKRLIAATRVEALIETSLWARVQLKLYSPLEEKVPYGAMSKYLNELIRKDLENAETVDKV